MTEDDKDQRKQGSGRREYDEANERLDEHIHENDQRLRRFFIGAIVAFAIIGIACTVSLIGFGVVLAQLKDTRRDFTRSLCESQNYRHAQTVLKFKEAQIVLAKKHPEQVKAIQESVDENLKIIDALVPLQDCEYLVKLSVGEVTPTPLAKKNP